MRAVTSPAATSKVTSRTAVRPPKATATSRSVITTSPVGGSIDGLLGLHGQ